MEDYRKLLAKTAVAELKSQLKASQIRGFSKMKKADIVDLLVSKKQYSQPTTPAHEAYVADAMAGNLPPAPIPVIHKGTPVSGKEPKQPKTPKVVKEKVVKEKVVKEKIAKQGETP